MATYSPKDFEHSRFNYKENVQLYLYAPSGAILNTVTGTLHAREKGVDVGEGRKKTLVWIKNIEDYEVPGDLPGQTKQKTEGWFAEHDIEKIDGEDLVSGLPRN